MLRETKSLKRAAAIQIVLFGLAHIKGFEAGWWVDVSTVMILAVAFTYAAYKTRALVTGMVFHFLHDAFLFLPQVPGVELVGTLEYVAFFGSLWVMVGVALILIKYSSDSLGVKAEEELYRLEGVPYA